MKKLAFVCALALTAPALAQRPLLGDDPGAGAVAGDTWSPPLLPQQTASFGAARVGDWLYVYSGHTGPTHHHALENLSHTFSRLSLIDGRTWEVLPCPLPLQSAMLVAYGDDLIRVGGMSARNQTADEDEDLYSTDTVARFDTATRTWHALPALPQARSSHAAAVLGDTLYVVGGWMLEGERAIWSETALALDLSADEPAWAELPKPPFEERRALAMEVVDGKLVVCGGMLATHGFTSEVKTYDPATQTWGEGPALPFKGFGVAVQTIGDTLYASGIDSELHALRPGAEGWEPVGSLIFPRYFHELIPLSDTRLLVLGGVTRVNPARRANEHLRVSEVVELAGDAPKLHAWTIPYPGAAKNRQGVFLHEDSLYVFGGNNSLEQHDFEVENFLSEARRIRLTTQRVESLPDFPVERQSLRTLVTAGETPTGLAVGGFGHTGEGTRSWEEVFAFDFGERAWTKRPLALPRPRTQFFLTQREGQVYAFGGLDYDSDRDEDFQFPTDVLRVEGDAFVPSGIELPQPRRAFGGALLGDKVYLAGGMKAGFELINEVDVYDFASQTWSTIPAPSEPRISPHLVPLNGKLYLIGGTTPRDGDSFVPNQRVEVFDPATGAWTTRIEELPISVRHMRFFPWRDRLLCYSANTPGVAAVRLLVIED